LIELDSLILPRVHQVLFVLSNARRVAAFSPSARLKEIYLPHGATFPIERILPRMEADRRGVMQLCLASRADCISSYNACWLVTTVVETA
jgi:hypothetical protein